MTKSVELTWIIITINLFIAAMIIVIMFEFKGLIYLVSSISLNLIVGVIGLYLSGYYFGNKMDYQINSKKRNSLLIGFIGLLIILLIGTFAGSSVEFLKYGYRFGYTANQLYDLIYEFYYTPFLLILYFGIIPTIITGMILGKIMENYD